MGTRARTKPALPRLSLPAPEAEHWYDHFSDSPEEAPDYDTVDINLGAESPGSVLDMDEELFANATNASKAQHLDVECVRGGKAKQDEWAKSGIAVMTDMPTRRRLWRSSSFSKKEKRKLKKELDDKDCGICFEVAVMPCRTLCCGKLFCLEHIAEWLHGSSSDGRCPSCESPCSLESNSLSLAPGPVVVNETPKTKQDRPSKAATLSPHAASVSRSLWSPSRSPLQHCSTADGSTDSQPNSTSETASYGAVLGRSLSHLLSIVGLTLVLFVLLRDRG